MSQKDDGPIRAAGGVVWRHGREANRGEPEPEVEVVVVHRPKYDDWTLPKGKADPGESNEDCARREVEEETGLECVLGIYLGEVPYLDRNGRPKVARYWAMQPVGGSFTPTGEVDKMRWLPLSDALDVLSYARDRPMLLALTPSTVTP